MENFIEACGGGTCLALDQVTPPRVPLFKCCDEMYDTERVIKNHKLYVNNVFCKCKHRLYQHDMSNNSELLHRKPFFLTINMPDKTTRVVNGDIVQESRRGKKLSAYPPHEQKILVIRNLNKFYVSPEYALNDFNYYLTFEYTDKGILHAHLILFITEDIKMGSTDIRANFLYYIKPKFGGIQYCDEIKDLNKSYKYLFKDVGEYSYYRPNGQIIRDSINKLYIDIIYNDCESETTQDEETSV